jgi:hypothetical protein
VWENDGYVRMFRHQNCDEVVIWKVCVIRTVRKVAGVFKLSVSIGNMAGI